MNSVLADLPEIQIDRSLMRFEHPEQWRSRPGWRERISLSEHNLARIIGGYNLAPEHWQHCGLCNTRHGRGYVVGTTEGLETQIGKDCGLKYLGAVFEELERRFTIALEAQDRMKGLRALLVRRCELLTSAKRALEDCDRAFASVTAIKHRIEREPSLAAVFRKAIAADGSVSIEYRASEDEYQITKRRYRSEVVARIDGHMAPHSSSPRAQIQDTVLPLIHSLSEAMLSNLTQKSLTAKSKEADDATGTLAEAQRYLSLANRFTSRKNWLAFASSFGPERHKTNDRGRRILQQLIEEGTE